AISAKLALRKQARVPLCRTGLQCGAIVRLVVLKKMQHVANQTWQVQCDVGGKVIHNVRTPKESIPSSIGTWIIENRLYDSHAGDAIAGIGESTPDDPAQSRLRRPVTFLVESSRPARKLHPSKGRLKLRCMARQ